MLDTPATSDYEEFARNNWAPLMRAGWVLTGDWYAAEDLVQTALTSIWQRWGQANTWESPARYSQAVLTNAFLQSRRRRWKAETPTLQLPERVQPGESLGQMEVRESLRTALALLSSRQRAVVTLRYFCDLSETQTAAILGCSIGSVKSHASRALMHLRNVGDLEDILNEVE